MKSKHLAAQKHAAVVVHMWIFYNKVDTVHVELDVVLYKLACLQDRLLGCYGLMEEFENLERYVPSQNDNMCQTQCEAEQ